MPADGKEHYVSMQVIRRSWKWDISYLACTDIIVHISYVITEDVPFVE